MDFIDYRLKGVSIATNRAQVLLLPASPRVLFYSNYMLTDAASQGLSETASDFLVLVDSIEIWP